MIKQTIVFSSPVNLSLKYNQLIIAFKDCDEVVSRPIEDIGVVIIENQQTHVTMPLLNALSDNKVSVIVCDNKGMPNHMLMPLEANATLQESCKCQIEASVPVKKKIWKNIVECKIRNQAIVLDMIGKGGNVLKPYYSNVLSGDKDNREGAAAKVYWQKMYGKDFRRDRFGGPPNTLLNYGYAILRAAVARSLLGSGLLPLFGIFHRNRYNAFPLADDVMEPYRPFVDLAVNEIFEFSQSIELTKDVKQHIVKVLTCDVKMNGKTSPLMVALSGTTASLARAFKDNKEKIVYPQPV